MPATQLLIVDDHLLIRSGLKRILEAEFGETMHIGEAENSEQALLKIQQAHWDVVVVDIHLPDRSGLVLLQEIKSHRPTVPVLILSAQSEEEFAVRVLRAGAAGFVAKECSHTELVKAIKTVLSGGKHISDHTAQMLVNELREPREKLPHQELSAREFEVLSMLAKGKTPTEIAQELSLSIKTVSTYRTRILEKLHLKTTAQLIHYALKNGLVDV